MGECLYSGKVKQVWSTDDPDILEFRYTDQISVFDQIIPSLIPRKGESLNRTTCHWFDLVAKEGICRTHIVQRNGSERCLVRRVDIYREPGTLPRDGEWVFVPLEFVCRHYLAGSGWRRYQRGELTAEELGFEAGTVLESGAKLPAPYLEITTKFEDYDRLIDREEALEIANISGEELDSLLQVVIKVDTLIEREALLRGLIHVDGKKEFALGPGRVPVLVDSFGTLDEDRWWDSEQYYKGNIVQLSKEFVRQHYIDSGHQDQVRTARESGNEDPVIPALPQEVIDQTTALYTSMYERLTGKEF
mgnify:CR=1 FL=1|jgi:phosphoribosylaminoimidazole-succinocarboxamide synthase